MELSEPQAANQVWWDSRVATHVDSAFYDVEGWLANRPGPRAREAALVGSVEGLDLVHLQCHFGKDTLSWADVGARVVGIDFSAPAIAAAQELAGRAGLDDRAEFVCAPVEQATTALSARTFDIVYVSLGSLCWLPSVSAWADQVGGLLRPGGRLFIHDTHPLSAALADDELVITYSYFEEPAPAGPFVEPGTYADLESSDPLPGHPTYEWSHSLGEIVNALIASGLVIDVLTEHDWTSFQRFTWLVQTDEETFITPPGLARVPLSFTLVATKS